VHHTQNLKLWVQTAVDGAANELLARWTAGASLSAAEKAACKTLLKSQGDYNAAKRARREAQAHRTRVLAAWNSGAELSPADKRLCKSLFASRDDYAASKSARKAVQRDLVSRWTAGASQSAEHKTVCKALLKARGDYARAKQLRADALRARAAFESGAALSADDRRLCRALYAGLGEYAAAKRARREAQTLERWDAGAAMSREEMHACKALLKARSRTREEYKARKEARRARVASIQPAPTAAAQQATTPWATQDVEGVRSWRAEDAGRVYKKGRWSADEDVALLEAVVQHAAALGLAQRDVVAYVSSNKTQRAERFTDAQLRALASLWELAGRSLPTRSLKAISQRAHTLMVPRSAMTHTPYSAAELAAIEGHVKAGKVDYVALEQLTGRPRRSLTSTASRLRKRAQLAAGVTE